MTVQTSYSTTHKAAYAGTVADLQRSNKVGKLNKTGATLGWGLGVVSDGDIAAKAPATGATADQFIGVTIRELNRAYQDGAADGAVDGYDFSIMTMGVIWVEALDAVSKDDDVYLRIGSTDTGGFAGAAGSGATESIQIPNMKYVSSASAGDLVQVSLVVGG